MPAPTSNTIPSSNPAGFAVAVTPSDSANIPTAARALYIGAAGNAAVVLTDGSVVSFVGLQAGSILPVAARRVNTTGTTASSIVALY